MYKRLLSLFAVTLLSASSLAAQKGGAKTNPLLKDARITEAVARQTALTKVPGGKVTESELEKEDGKLVWSFDIKVAGKSGIEEVQVDAITGDVVAVEHESPDDEKKEADADKAKAKAKAKKKP